MGKISKITLAYIAGIFDGEGCVSISKEKERTTIKGYSYRLRVIVGNTNEWLIKFLQSQFGGNIVLRQPRMPWYKPIWQWQIGAKLAQVFLEALLPYLQLKKHQAELGIAFQNKFKGRGHRKTTREWILLEQDFFLMRQYNKKGK